jgi:hypothetical protein
LIICLNLIYSNETKKHIEIDLFIKIADNKTSCPNIRNNLYLINSNMFIWVVDRKYPDSSYEYTLFEKNPQIIFCKILDYIAGPQEFYNNDKYPQIFELLINNINEENLVLDIKLLNFINENKKNY